MGGVKTEAVDGGVNGFQSDGVPVVWEGRNGGTGREGQKFFAAAVIASRMRW